MADKDKPKAKAKDTAPKGRLKAVAPEAWPPLIGLTVDEAAAALRTDDKTIRKLIQSGEIPARIVGRGYRIDPDALRAWVASGTDGQNLGPSESEIAAHMAEAARHDPEQRQRYAKAFGGEGK